LTPLTMDLVLEIRLMVHGRRPTLRIFSLHIDPRDTTNKDSFSILKSATPPSRGVAHVRRESTPNKQKTKVEASNDKATSNFRGRSKTAGSTDSMYKSE
jgi:hypothetical protein